MASGSYARIRQSFWTDPDIKHALTIEQKALLLYYFSSPHSNMIGLFYCPFGYAAAETGLPIEQVEEWTSGDLAPFVTYDQRTEEILVHGAAKHQVQPTLAFNDKRAVGARRLLDEAHSKWLVGLFIDRNPEWDLRVPNPVAEAPSKPLTKGLTKPLRSPLPSHSSSSSTAKQNGSSLRSEPAPPENLNALLAPVVRRILWLSDDPRTPPALLREDPKWSMGRELDIAKKFIARGEQTAAEIVGAIEHCRRTLNLPPDRPLTMKLFNVAGRHDRMAVCVAAWKKGQTKPNPLRIDA